MYTVPSAPVGTSCPLSSRMRISEPGQGLPTVPGLVIHSDAVTMVPPPSVAA